MTHIPTHIPWWRASLVIALTLTTSVVLVSNLPPPATKNLLSGQQPYHFPASVSLPGWQQMESQTIPLQANPPALAARRYSFVRGGHKIAAELWYLRYVEGNVSRFLSIYTKVESTLQLQEIYQSQIGYAGLLTTKNHVYLSSCLNAQGPTTLTEAQFAQNRYEYDLKPTRILSWFLGQQDLLDRRCFFTVLSVALEDQAGQTPLSAPQAQQILQEVWPIWHKVLQPQFPPS